MKHGCTALLYHVTSSACYFARVLGMFTVTDFIKILLKYHSASQVCWNILCVSVSQRISAVLRSYGIGVVKVIDCPGLHPVDT